MSRTITLAAAAVALFAALPLSAEAMPIAPATSADAGVTLVAGGCGPGFVHCVDRCLTDRGLRLIQAVAQILDAAGGGGHVGFG